MLFRWTCPYCGHPNTDSALPSAPSSEAPTAAELEVFRRKYALGWTASENLLIAHLVARLRCAAATPEEF